jgi:hypothetical protein
VRATSGNPSICTAAEASTNILTLLRIVACQASSAVVGKAGPARRPRSMPLRYASSRLLSNVRVCRMFCSMLQSTSRNQSADFVVLTKTHIALMHTEYIYAVYVLYRALYRYYIEHYIGIKSYIPLCTRTGSRLHPLCS